MFTNAMSVAVVFKTVLKSAEKLSSSRVICSKLQTEGELTLKPLVDNVPVDRVLQLMTADL